MRCEWRSEGQVGTQQAFQGKLKRRMFPEVKQPSLSGKESRALRRAAQLGMGMEGQRGGTDPEEDFGLYLKNNGKSLRIWSRG